MAFTSRPKSDKEQKDVEHERLEAALEAGLEGTFPASDAVAVTPASTRTLHRPNQLTLSRIPGATNGHNPRRHIYCSSGRACPIKRPVHRIPMKGGDIVEV